MFICSICGIIMISTMVVAIVNTLMLSINENKAFLCIKKLSFRAHVKKVSASIVTTFARFRKKVKNSEPISKAEIQTLRERMDSFKVDLRELKSIRDDDPNDVFVQFNIIKGLNQELLLYMSIFTSIVSKYKILENPNVTEEDKQMISLISQLQNKPDLARIKHNLSNLLQVIPFVTSEKRSFFIRLKHQNRS